MLHDARSATNACWHPDVGSQLSTVQRSPSSQFSGVPAVQTPARHVSMPLQMLPSLHDASDRHGGGGAVVAVPGAVGVVTVAAGVGPGRAVVVARIVVVVQVVVGTGVVVVVAVVVEVVGGTVVVVVVLEVVVLIRS